MVLLLVLLSLFGHPVCVCCFVVPSCWQCSVFVALWLSGSLVCDWFCYVCCSCSPCSSSTVSSVVYCCGFCIWIMVLLFYNSCFVCIYSLVFSCWFYLLFWIIYDFLCFFSISSVCYLSFSVSSIYIWVRFYTSCCSSFTFRLCVAISFIRWFILICEVAVSISCFCIHEVFLSRVSDCCCWHMLFIWVDSSSDSCAASSLVIPCKDSCLNVFSIISCLSYFSIVVRFNSSILCWFL